MQSSPNAFQKADARAASLHYRLRAEKMFETRPVPPTEENYALFTSELEGISQDIAGLRPTDGANQIVVNHLRDFLQAERLEVQNYFTRPDRAIQNFCWRVDFETGTDSRDAEARAVITKDILQALPDIVASSERLVEDASARRAFVSACDQAADSLEDLRENLKAYYAGISPAQAEDLKNTIQLALSSLNVGAPQPGDQPTETTDADCVPFSEAYYRAVLSDTLGISLDDLLAWHEDMITDAREEMLRIAGNLPLSSPPRTPEDVQRVLNQHAGPADTPEEMFARMREYLSRAERAARDWVWFPDQVCELTPTPHSLLSTFPWGGYMDGDGRRRPITGKTFLNVGNFRAITDGWLRMQALHEAYPGHHIQYVRTVADALPETFKIGAKHIPLIEGTAHRTERVFAFVFDDTPYYPLFAAYRRLHTAVRIKSDLMLRLWGRPIGECARLYMDELGFDAGTARGQVRAQESMEGYFNAYAYGLKRIENLEADIGLDAKSFTEELFSCGNISLDNLEAVLRLTDAERKSLRRDYRSLFMEGDLFSRPSPKAFPFGEGGRAK